MRLVLFVVVLAVACISFSDATERTRVAFQNGAAATKTKITLCRADDRDPQKIKEAGGFCPKKASMLCHTTAAALHKKFYKSGDKEWDEFLVAHKDKNFDFFVSTSDNCGDTGMTKGFQYKIELDLEKIHDDLFASATTVDDKTELWVYRGAKQSSNYEWDSFNCIPLKYVTEVDTSGKGASYKKIDWAAEKGTEGKPLVAGTCQKDPEVDAQFAWGMRKSYSGAGVTCATSKDCAAQPILKKCCSTFGKGLCGLGDTDKTKCTEKVSMRRRLF